MRLRFLQLTFVTFCAVFSAGLAHAQQLMAEYYTILGGPDLTNSSGVPLSNFCAIVQQDRANYHRFGLRQDGDQFDPIFADRAKRARISSICQMAPGSEYVPGSLAQYGTKYVFVRVYGSGGVPTLVLVAEGAG